MTKYPLNSYITLDKIRCKVLGELGDLRFLSESENCHDPYWEESCDSCVYTVAELERYGWKEEQPQSGTMQFANQEYLDEVKKNEEKIEELFAWLDYHNFNRDFDRIKINRRDLFDKVKELFGNNP